MQILPLDVSGKPLQSPRAVLRCCAICEKLDSVNIVQYRGEKLSSIALFVKKQSWSCIGAQKILTAMSGKPGEV